MSLAWDASTDNVGVAGYYVQANGGRVRVSSPAFTERGLECGQSVWVEVAAFDAANNRSGKSTVIASTAPCSDVASPTPPSGFRQAATTQTSVVLEWDASADNVGVVRYGVYRGTQMIDAPVEPSTTVLSLACGSSVQLHVDAADAAGNRSSRSPVWITTADCSDGQPPTPPTNVSVAGRTATSVTLTWDASTDNVGVAGYRLRVGGVTVATVTETTATATGLTCGSTYALEVDAYDAAGNRSAAASVSATTSACDDPPPPPPGDTSAPSQPAGLAVTQSTMSSISLSWSASTDNVGVVGYDVFANGVYRLAVTQPGAVLTGLTCGTAYDVGVEARDAASNRSTRASLTASTASCADTTPPSAPANVTATSRTATSITLSWDASSDNVGVTGYGLHRGGSFEGTTTATTRIFGGLSCGTNYTLGVDARDAAGNTSSATTVMVATTACGDTTPPSAPTGLTASGLTQTALQLSWNAASDNVGVTGYDVYRNGSKVATVTGTQHDQTGLACATPYTFGVVARDAAGNSSATVQTSASTTACSAPIPASSWTVCANEGQQCSFTGSKDVRYGAPGGNYTTPRTFSAPVSCSNSVFGDPAPGVSKRCEMREASSSPPPPPPPDGGSSLDDFTDFRNNVWTEIFLNRWKSPPAPGWTQLGYVGEPWSDGSGIYEVSTAHGPGFRFLQGTAVPRGSGEGMQMADVDNMVDQQNYLGTVTDVSGKVMFPASGNPTGFPAYGDWNCLWEFTEGVAVFNQFGVDGLQNKLYVRTYNQATNYTRKALAPSTIQYDRWYDWRWQIKWSRGSDGFVNFWIDGQQIASWTGPNLPSASSAPHLQWGWYGGNQTQKNEVVYAALRKA